MWSVYISAAYIDFTSLNSNFWFRICIPSIDISIKGNASQSCINISLVYVLVSIKEEKYVIWYLLIPANNDKKNEKFLYRFGAFWFLSKQNRWLYREEIVIFYTEILTGKVVLWWFFSSETSEKIHNSTFKVKISA